MTCRAHGHKFPTDVADQVPGTTVECSVCGAERIRPGKKPHFYYRFYPAKIGLQVRKRGSDEDRPE